MVLFLYLWKYKNSDFIDDVYRRKFYLLFGTVMGWSAIRIYRSIHGLAQNDVIFDMLGDTTNGEVIGDGFLYFISNLLPYLFLISPLVYPSFFLTLRNNKTYKELNGRC
mmetsp:Transcript_964/g.926  ORF Transcript_964/g.926 Transcript_964/m.926 type:complete len:109 (+) Transcript_964:570-896(+)